MIVIDWLTPWEFSPTLVVVFIASAWLFWRGAKVHHVGKFRQWLIWVGQIILYLTLHTRVDYYAERMFFIHRLQHLVLHHLGPLIIMGAYPGQVMRAGLPLSWRYKLRDFRRTGIGKVTERVLTHPVLIPFLFVFFVLIWLLPIPQFYSMIDWRLYRFMNWSVVISGVLYWNLILDRRPSPPAAMRPVGRVLSPIITMTPQIIVGVWITFSTSDLYPIFDLCGRAMPSINALEDQGMGGLIMWVLAGLVETFGVIYALATAMRLSSRNRLPLPTRKSPAVARLNKSAS